MTWLLIYGPQSEKRGAELGERVCGLGTPEIHLLFPCKWIKVGSEMVSKTGAL